jgi:hypothetical protein
VLQRIQIFKPCENADKSREDGFDTLIHLLKLNFRVCFFPDVTLNIKVVAEPSQKLLVAGKILNGEGDESTFNQSDCFLQTIDFTSDGHVGDQEFKSRSIYMRTLVRLKPSQ